MVRESELLNIVLCYSRTQNLSRNHVTNYEYTLFTNTSVITTPRTQQNDIKTWNCMQSEVQWESGENKTSCNYVCTICRICGCRALRVYVQTQTHTDLCFISFGHRSTVNTFVSPLSILIFKDGCDAVLYWSLARPKNQQRLTVRSERQKRSTWGDLNHRALLSAKQHLTTEMLHHPEMCLPSVPDPSRPSATARTCNFSLRKATPIYVYGPWQLYTAKTERFYWK